MHFHTVCDTITVAKAPKGAISIEEDLLMNKSELISEKAVNAFIDTVKEAIAQKDKVQLIGFGTFEARVRKARNGKNPRTGETIKIKKATVPAFKAGKAFKDAVNK